MSVNSLAISLHPYPKFKCDFSKKVYVQLANPTIPIYPASQDSPRDNIKCRGNCIFCGIWVKQAGCIDKHREPDERKGAFTIIVNDLRFMICKDCRRGQWNFGLTYPNSYDYAYNFGTKNILY